MQVGAADRGAVHPQEYVVRLLDLRAREPPRRARPEGRGTRLPACPPSGATISDPHNHRRAAAAVRAPRRNPVPRRQGRLRGVSAALPEGAACIAGPSGSGKSTLLRLLDRLADPDQGEVRYRGRRRARARRAGAAPRGSLVPQLPALLEGTVADNIRSHARSPARSPDIGTAARTRGPRSSFAGPRRRTSSRSASSSG